MTFWKIKSVVSKGAGRLFPQGIIRRKDLVGGVAQLIGVVLRRTSNVTNVSVARRCS